MTRRLSLRTTGFANPDLAAADHWLYGDFDYQQRIVDNGNLTLTLNGKLQNVATNTENLAGQIGLQSEGGIMEFREVELQPIEKGKSTRI